ncbi:ABC transporter permease subunit [Leucobacter sp. CSA2]|uniref:ABC transporter permease subunit n=1 Tax=Leucobacter edaphi TaxID=2796472 RepID=A0A934QD34_9MICO|nr:ABC transporter permease subunit [Leucobacter edaphi]
MLADALRFLTDGTHWSGPDGIPVRLAEHLGLSALAILIGACVAIPIGVLIGHTRRGIALAVGAINVLRALPSLGLLTLLALLLGLGLLPPLATLVALAIPPLLAGSYSGIANITAATVDAARAMGMTEWQIVARVEGPLAAPLILTGLRNAALQVIATATIAAYVNEGGIGRFIFDGLALHDYGRMLVGAALVTALALAVDGCLALIEKFAEFPGVRGRVTA